MNLFTMEHGSPNWCIHACIDLLNIEHQMLLIEFLSLKLNCVREQVIEPLRFIQTLSYNEDFNNLHVDFSHLNLCQEFRYDFIYYVKAKRNKQTTHKTKPNEFNTNLQQHTKNRIQNVADECVLATIDLLSPPTPLPAIFPTNCSGCSFSSISCVHCSSHTVCVCIWASYNDWILLQCFGQIIVTTSRYEQWFCFRFITFIK